LTIWVFGISKKLPLNQRKTKMKINIIGAGMSGLLCANMLRRHEIIVYEKQPKLPNNHHAVLRFRTPEVGNILGIPFKKVNMIKTYIPFSNIVADSLSYSRKVTGQFLSDRSIIAGTVQAERWIAPSYLIRLMAENINVEYENINVYHPTYPIISTIPMPDLMNLLNYDPSHNIGFDYKPGIVFSAKILECDAYVSILNPGPQAWSRATITGNQLIIEFPSMKEIPETYELAEVYHQMGLYDAVMLDGEFKKQNYFKIMDIDNAERKKFMRWATVKHNIYSLGRYATWRPKLLLDDLVQDVRKIEEWIIGSST
jgi:hypothetical protein